MLNTFEKKFVTYCHEQELEVNINQIEVIKKLEKYFQNNFKSFFSELFSKQSLKKGFYLYGDVGVGKTMILNFFFNQVDEKKIRQHFNEFMLSFHDFVHEQKEKNSENVINQFVQNLKSKASLIYFDEFQVTNIVDAMILGKLFDQIFKEDPLGWFQWYCRFYNGRRIPHIDEIQIKRWKNFRRHVLAIEKNCEKNDLGCRRRQRQAILQWAYNPFI